MVSFAFSQRYDILQECSTTLLTLIVKKHFYLTLALVKSAYFIVTNKLDYDNGDDFEIYVEVFCHVLMYQSIVDIFDGIHDMASVYVSLHDNRLFLSDRQQSSDYQLARIKVGV